MTEGDRTEQEAIHDAIDGALDLDGDLLIGWCLTYEATAADGDTYAGHVYGPSGMTTWRALGLIEWARRFGLHPDDVHEDDTDS